MKTLLICLALMLTGCGGGDWDEEELRKEVPRVNCEDNQNKCS